MTEELKQPTEFDPKVSLLIEAYELLGAISPFDLHKKYVEDDQIYFKNGKQDYNNPDLLFNKAKVLIESVGLENLKEKEEMWSREILWFWYHHAISSARVMYPNQELAQAFASKALELQNGEHPNQITQLLYYLVHHDVESAEAWVPNIVDVDDREVVAELIQDYKDNMSFYKNKT